MMEMLGPLGGNDTLLAWPIDPWEQANCCPASAYIWTYHGPGAERGNIHGLCERSCLTKPALVVPCKIWGAPQYRVMSFSAGFYREAVQSAWWAHPNPSD